jgi:hypothetical protein
VRINSISRNAETKLKKKKKKKTHQEIVIKKSSRFPRKNFSPLFFFLLHSITFSASPKKPHQLKNKNK